MMQTGFAPMPKIVLKSPALSMQAKTLYCLLIDFAWFGEAFPGRDTLGELNGVHPNSIDSYMKELKDLGLVEVIRRGLRQTNLYVIEDITEELAGRLEPPSKSVEIPDSQPTVNQDSQPTVTLDSHPTVNKEEEGMRRNRTENKPPTEGTPGPGKGQRTLVPLPPSPTRQRGSETPQRDKRKMSGPEVSQEKIQLARTGSIPWDDVSDRDFVFYFIEVNNLTMQQPITFDRYSSVTIIRENLIKAFNIPRDKVCDYIDELFRIYSEDPSKWTSLTFGMVQKNTSMMRKLMDLVDQKLRPVERTFQVNVAKTTGTTGQVETF